MTATYQGYQWVAGFNNAGSLVAVELSVPTYQNKLFHVHSIGSWDEGIKRYGADSSISAIGFVGFDWIADLISDVQYNAIRSTKTAGGTGLSGEVTVRTLKTTDTGSPNYTPVFANYNAILQLPKKTEMTDRIWRAYRNVPLHFVIVEAL